MRILFDQGTPAPLRSMLIGHQVVTAHERGWSQLENGDLLAFAEAEGFEALVTTDRNLKYQQNLAGRTMAILVLTTTNWPRIKVAGQLVVAAVEQLASGGFVELEIP